MRRIVCVLNITGHPSKRIHTYPLRLCPLNFLFFVCEEGVGVGVGVGITSIVRKDYHLHLPCRWANSIFFTFLSHQLHIIDPNTFFSFSCCGYCCCCFFIIFFIIFFLSLLVSFLIVACFAIKNYIPVCVPHR